GIEWPEPRERFRRLSEAVKLIRRLWTEELVEFDGEYYHVHGATVYDRPEQPVPIYVAATGEVAAKFAGRQADGFICTSGKGPERRWLVASEPEEHIEQIAPYLELGFTHLVFHSPGDDQAGFLRRYAAEILPRLRERWG